MGDFDPMELLDFEMDFPPAYDFLVKFEDSLCCAICCEVYTAPNELSCGHHFCSACITRWLSKGNDCCPTCRTQVVKIDIRVNSKLSDVCEQYQDMKPLLIKLCKTKSKQTKPAVENIMDTKLISIKQKDDAKNVKPNIDNELFIVSPLVKEKMKAQRTKRLQENNCNNTIMYLDDTSNSSFTTVMAAAPRHESTNKKRKLSKNEINKMRMGTGIIYNKQLISLKKLRDMCKELHLPYSKDISYDRLVRMHKEFIVLHNQTVERGYVPNKKKLAAQCQEEDRELFMMKRIKQGSIKSSTMTSFAGFGKLIRKATPRQATSSKSRNTTSIKTHHSTNTSIIKAQSQVGTFIPDNNNNNNDSNMIELNSDGETCSGDKLIEKEKNLQKNCFSDTWRCIYSDKLNKPFYFNTQTLIGTFNRPFVNGGTVKQPAGNMKSSNTISVLNTNPIPHPQRFSTGVAESKNNIVDAKSLESKLRDSSTTTTSFRIGGDTNTIIDNPHDNNNNNSSTSNRFSNKEQDSENQPNQSNKRPFKEVDDNDSINNNDIADHNNDTVFVPSEPVEEEFVMELSLPATPTEVSCSVCTLLNPISRSKCLVCLSKLDKSHITHGMRRRSNRKKPRKINGKCKTSDGITSNSGIKNYSPPAFNFKI